MAPAENMRTLAVVACAQNVVAKPRASAVKSPASPDPVHARTEPLTPTRASAASSAERTLMATAGETKGKREMSQLSRV